MNEGGLGDIFDGDWQFAPPACFPALLGFIDKPTQAFSSLLPIMDLSNWVVRIFFEVSLN